MQTLDAAPSTLEARVSVSSGVEEKWSRRRRWSEQWMDGCAERAQHGEALGKEKVASAAIGLGLQRCQLDGEAEVVENMEVH